MKRKLANDEVSQFMRDSRAADTRMVSSVADAQELVRQFEGHPGPGAWPALDRKTVGSRLRALIANPRLFQQGALNLCGPATFLCMWTGRDPVGFAGFATALFEDGAATIGTLQVAPSAALLQQDYATMLARMQGNISPQADWMTMGALRNNDDALFVWTGDPRQELPGLTMPAELQRWLVATGIYSQVKNEANWTSLAGWPHVSGLLEYGGQDIALLLNTNALLGGMVLELRNRNDAGNAPEPTLADNSVAPEDRFVLKQFPNHYVMLLNSPTTNYDPADPARGTAWLSIWTWGQSLGYAVPARAFVANYYGAVIATLP